MTKTTRIFRDAQGKRMGIERVDSSGTRIDTDGYIEMLLEACEGLGLKLRRAHFEDKDGDKKYAVVLTSPPQVDSDPEDPKNTEDDLWIAGGGGWNGPYNYDGTPGSWTKNDVVVVCSGVNTGTYVCVHDNPTVAPWVGGTGGVVFWVQLPGTKGAWS